MGDMQVIPPPDSTHLNAGGETGSELHAAKLITGRRKFFYVFGMGSWRQQWHSDTIYWRLLELRHAIFFFESEPGVLFLKTCDPHHSNHVNYI